MMSESRSIREPGGVSSSRQCCWRLLAGPLSALTHTRPYARSTRWGPPVAPPLLHPLTLFLSRFLAGPYACCLRQCLCCAGLPGRRRRGAAAAACLPGSSGLCCLLALPAVACVCCDLGVYFERLVVTTVDSAGEAQAGRLRQQQTGAHASQGRGVRGEPTGILRKPVG